MQVTDACAPRVTASPSYTCRRHKRDFDPLGCRRPTVHPVRVIEAVELVACHVFTLAEQTRQRLTFGDVERYLAQLLAAHPGDCGCRRSVLAPRVTAHRVYAIASGWQRQVRATQPECAHCVEGSSRRSARSALGRSAVRLCKQDTRLYSRLG